MDKAVPRPWAPRRCSHGPPGSTDARRAEGTCGGPGQRTSETVRKGSSHKKSERAIFFIKQTVQDIFKIINHLYFIQNDVVHLFIFDKGTNILIKRMGIVIIPAI